jgi:hypothetical protein
MAEWKKEREGMTLAIDGLSDEIDRAENQNDFYSAVEELVQYGLSILPARVSP